jgi:hypothetical protein
MAPDNTLIATKASSISEKTKRSATYLANVPNAEPFNQSLNTREDDKIEI